MKFPNWTNQKKFFTHLCIKKDESLHWHPELNTHRAMPGHGSCFLRLNLKWWQHPCHESTSRVMKGGQSCSDWIAQHTPASSNMKSLQRPSLIPTSHKVTHGSHLMLSHQIHRVHSRWLISQHLELQSLQPLWNLYYLLTKAAVAGKSSFTLMHWVQAHKTNSSIVPSW